MHLKGDRLDIAVKSSGCLSNLNSIQRDASQVVAEPSRNFNISRRERLKIQPLLLVILSARYFGRRKEKDG